MLDLRSDTVTRPDAEMRRAMAVAEVGDDVYGEDPTVRELEELAAEIAGHEEALFVPSGTMGNQIALHVHGVPGGEVVGEAASHVFHFEMGAMAAISGLVPRPVSGSEGRLGPPTVADAVRPDLGFLSRTVVLLVENTHNMAGGVVLGPENSDALVEVGRRHGIPVHLDGARLFNAAVASETAPSRLAAGFDSVMFALSKGLGAPVGSLLCGPRPFVEEARRVRKMLGGGMRQAGIIAAAGLVALRRGFDHLVGDHERAERVAAAMSELEGVRVDPWPETNIVMVTVEGDDPEPAGGLVDRLAAAGIRASALDSQRVRLVTHRDVDGEALEEALERLVG